MQKAKSSCHLLAVRVAAEAAWLRRLTPGTRAAGWMRWKGGSHIAGRLSGREKRTRSLTGFWAVLLGTMAWDPRPSDLNHTSSAPRIFMDSSLWPCQMLWLCRPPSSHHVELASSFQSSSAQISASSCGDGCALMLDDLEKPLGLVCPTLSSSEAKEFPFSSSEPLLVEEEMVVEQFAHSHEWDLRCALAL